MASRRKELRWEILYGNRRITLKDLGKKEVADAYRMLLARFGQEPSPEDQIWQVLINRLRTDRSGPRNPQLLMGNVLARRGRLYGALQCYIIVALDDLADSPRLGIAPYVAEKIKLIAEYESYTPDWIAQRFGAVDLPHWNQWPALRKQLWPE